jgi:hypothetical protein
MGSSSPNPPISLVPEQYPDTLASALTPGIDGWPPVHRVGPMLPSPYPQYTSPASHQQAAAQPDYSPLPPHGCDVTEVRFMLHEPQCYRTALPPHVKRLITPRILPTRPPPIPSSDVTSAMSEADLGPWLGCAARGSGDVRYEGEMTITRNIGHLSGAIGDRACHLIGDVDIPACLSTSMKLLGEDR